MAFPRSGSPSAVAQVPGGAAWAGGRSCWTPQALCLVLLTPLSSTELTLNRAFTARLASCPAGRVAAGTTGWEGRAGSAGPWHSALPALGKLGASSPAWLTSPPRVGPGVPSSVPPGVLRGRARAGQLIWPLHGEAGSGRPSLGD